MQPECVWEDLSSLNVVQQLTSTCWKESAESLQMDECLCMVSGPPPPRKVYVLTSTTWGGAAHAYFWSHLVSCGADFMLGDGADAQGRVTT